MKKKKQKQQKKNIWSALILSVALIISVAIIGVVYNLSTTGQAIKVSGVISSPPAQPIAFDNYDQVKMDFDSLDKLPLMIKYGKKTESFILEVDEKDGLVSYDVKKDGSSSEASGLLSSAFPSTGAIYLDEDKFGDLQLSISGKVLTITNLGFVKAAVSYFEAYNKDLLKLNKNVLPFSYDKTKTIQDEGVYYLNITSTSVPTVTARLKGGAAKQLTVKKSGEKFKLVEFKMRPTSEKPEILVVESLVGDKKTTGEYILSVNGNIFQRAHADFPEIKLKQLSATQYQVSYSFKKIEKLQPFAMLCGTVDLSKYASNVSTVFSYKDGAEQWKEGKPSDFRSVSANKGYVLKLHKNVNLDFTVKCDGLPNVKPDLSRTWNLFGVSGFHPVTLEDVNKEVPAGKKIVSIFEYSNKEVKKISPTVFEPGKIYWIKVS